MSLPKPVRSLVGFLAIAGVFTLVYCQAPLYYSNQNQYFLHGLAWAGVGNLHEDWLAQTLDPTPVFSFVVMVTARFLHETLFYIWYAILQGVYALTMVKVFSFLAGPRDSWRLRLVFFGAFVLVHAALLRWGSYRLMGWDCPWYLQAGVAGQYVLGGIFQPSAFGVFLILSVYLFVRKRPYWAVASACLAATIHPTYVLTAGLLTVGYLYDAKEERHAKTLRIGGLALALVAPVVVYSLTVFAETTPKTLGYAEDLLVNVRIPHHSLPALWCDWVAAGQVLWMLLGVVLAVKTRLGRLMLTVFILAAVLTLIQVVTGSAALALLFPWRASVILVPLATTIILSRLVLLGARWFEKTPAVVAGGAVIGGLAVAGLVLMVLRQGFQSSPDEVELLAFVRADKSPGDVYLLPVTIPPLKTTTKGSVSSDWKPAADKKNDPKLVPVDLQRFRLATGAAIYVDFKAIPYKDVEVSEWHARLLWAQEVYKELAAGSYDAAVEELRKNQVTHVVVRADRDLSDQRLEMAHADAAYRVYRLREK